MSEQSIKKGTMAKDTVIYMIAKGVEGLVGVLTVSELTHLFLPAQMGQYSTVNIAVTTTAMICIQWLVQSILRYINKYDLENEHEKFYTTIFSAWLKINLLVTLVSSFVILLMQTVLYNIAFVNRFMKVYSIKILILGVIMFIAYNTAQLVIAMLAAVRKTKTNLFLSVLSVTGKLAMIVILANLYGRNIEWIFISYAVFDGITSIVGIMKLKIYKYINLKNSSDEILDTLKAYGIPLLGNVITTSILNKSDIYIVTFYKGEASAGIYQTNYSIVASAFTMLSAAIMRGSYPTIVRTWSEGKKDMSANLVSEAVRFFLIVSIPAVIGVSVLSKSIASILFESQYVEGHSVMGFVALGMMFLGLTEYSIKPWELNANTKAIFYRSLIGGIINIIINIIFVPFFGYKTAAVSTFLGFFIYFFLAKAGTKNLMKWKLNAITYIRIILSSVIMAVVVLIIKKIIGESTLSLFIMVISGIAAYSISMYATGEVKSEVKAILNHFKRV